MQKIKVISVNTSKKKGTIKQPVGEICINHLGVVDDAHAGMGYRQVSLLASESIARGSLKAGRELNPGLFAENITTQGFELYRMKRLDRLVSGNIELMVTQIGKKCHSGCEIFKEVGDCVMPKEGIFCKVIEGGKLSPNDILEYCEKVFDVRIIALSNQALKSEYNDLYSEEIKIRVGAFFSDNKRAFTITKQVICDENDELETLIKKYTAYKADIIFITGRTDTEPFEITTDAIEPLGYKELPELMEFIHLNFDAYNPKVAINHSIGGTFEKTLVYCLPASPKEVLKYMAEIQKTLFHNLYKINDLDIK